MEPGEGLLTDMRAVRKDYFLDHDHSAYVDQWDWEKAIRPEDRTLDYLTDTVKRIWKVLKEAEDVLLGSLPGARRGVPAAARGARVLPCRGRARDVSRPAAEAARDGAPAGPPGGVHLRDRLAARRRSTRTSCGRPTTTTGRRRRSRRTGGPMHGLNGDILVWNPVTRRRHELMSGGIRVTKDTLRRSSSSPGSSTSSSSRTTRRSCGTRSPSRSARGSVSRAR